MRRLMLPLLVFFGMGLLSIGAARADDKPADAKPAKKTKKHKKATKADAPANDKKADAPANP